MRFQLIQESEDDVMIYTMAYQLETDAIFAQIGDQGEAARIGSALAGRPLRVFTPAVAAGMTKPGYCGTVLTGGYLDPSNDFGATAIFDLVNFANANRLILDQHTNYTSLADFQETVDKIKGVFTGDPLCNQSPWGTGPDFVASLENGPIPTKGWWVGNSFDAKQFFAPDHTCNPDDTWDQFVDGWFTDENEFFGNFHIPEVFGAAALDNLQYVCVNTTQQGIQSDGSLSKTVMGTLIADLMHPSCVDDANLFMPIKTDYQNAAAGFQIIPFVPHPNPCDNTVVCPQ